MTENTYRKRERLLAELREELGWEGAILLKVDGKHGASLLCSTADDAGDITRAIVPALGDVLPGVLAAAYEGTGATTVDFVDRLATGAPAVPEGGETA